MESDGSSTRAAAERPRRSISAARAAQAGQEADGLSQRASFASALQDDGYEDCGSMYKDAVSAQPSKGSVQSGAHEQGETFFTALKRQYSWQSDEDAEPQDGSSPASASLHSSGFFSVAGADDEASGLLAPAVEGVAAATASAEASYATAAGPEAGSQLTASVLDVINGVYGGAPDAADRPGTAAAEVTEARVLVGSGSAASLHEHSPAPAAEASSPGSSSATAEPGDVDKAGSSAAEPAEPAEPELSSSSLSSVQPSEPPCAAAALEAAETAADEAAAAVESPEDSAALLAHVDGLLDARSKVQAELGGYLQHLSSQEDGEGQLLQARLDSEAYGVLVERLLAEGRAQSYRALQGWKGLHRFEDLPIATLSAAAAGADPQVVAGLVAIAKLDEELREASLKALVAARASNPQHWADAEKRRLERRAGQLDAALAAERARRLHAAKLRRTLIRLDDEGGGAGGLTDVPGRGGGVTSYSNYRLAPQEEQLLATVMARDDAALEADDPFDPMLLCPGDDGLSEAEHDSSTSSVASTPVPAPDAADTEHTGGSCSFSGLSSCLGSSLFDLMRRPSTAGSHSSGGGSSGSGASQARRLSLADINAQLEVIQAKRAAMEQQAAEQEGKPQFAGVSRSGSKKGSSVLSAQSSIGSSAPSRIPAGLSSQTAAARSGNSSTSNAPSRIPSGISSAAAASASAAHQPSSQPESGSASCRTSGSHGTSRRESSASAAVSTGPSAHEGSVSSAGSRSSAVHTIDPMREQREARRLHQREAELDAQLRVLQTSALPVRLAQDQLQALLQSAY